MTANLRHKLPVALILISLYAVTGCSKFTREQADNVSRSCIENGGQPSIGAGRVVCDAPNELNFK
jgi:hypothetical protein